MVELRHLKGFVALAEELNFGRAAARLHMSQSAMSRLVGGLEGEVGVELINRSHHHVELTAAGEAFLPQARAALADVEAAVQTARQAASDCPPPLRVGHTEWTEDTLGPLLRAFRCRHPGRAVAVCQLDQPAQARRLVDGVVDVGLSRSQLDDPRLASQVILEEPLVVALANDHPLASEDRIAVAQLADSPFVLFDRHLCPCTHEAIHTLCEDAGFTPRTAEEAPSLMSVVVLIAAGVGVCLVPASASVRLGSGGIVYRPIAGRAACVPLVATWRRRDPPAAVSDFIGVARHTTV